ncbi:hypothetical protein TSAR_014903 [Trichomalopsis sarcophagae]|uniref:Exocyst component Exo84 C-terminal domain-containing protein n=1 Tax=Trichomalopsis sarcophagae TaxID=543379 RepID=A0A232F3G1_9HYME|nr:hypothetical protein TSAR_014903 [Trichomalopsis sarcophagae]
MPYSFAKSFIEADFDAEKFVKDLSSQCVGAEELRQQRAKIQELSDTTSALLKHNVYQNYIQFIETAKEISHLESEMYQLSQLLSEQRSLLSVLATHRKAGIVLEEDEFLQNNVLDVHSKEKEAKQKLTKLLENVDGAASLVETPGRICLYEGSLLELDPLDGTPLKRIHAYLFNDILMISSWLSNSNKRGPPKFRMQVVYDLKSLAVINVKDLGSIKLALKLLAFPDTRIFQCPTATNKKEWLDKYDQAKKSRISQESSIINNQQQLISSSLVSSDSNIVCIENEIEFNEISPDWLLETTEDLDSYIAQRHFEDAYNLFYKAKAFVASNKTSRHLREIEIALNDRAYKLISVITKEIESSADAKSLQGGGLRSARRAVRLLIQLERTAKACQLYLRLCSAALKASIKRVKREGSTVAYVKQVSAIAFSNMAEVAREFLKNFPCYTSCSSEKKRMKDRVENMDKDSAEKKRQAIE